MAVTGRSLGHAQCPVLPNAQSGVIVSLVASELSMCLTLADGPSASQTRVGACSARILLNESLWGTPFQNPASVLCRNPSSCVEREVPEGSPLAGHPVSTKPQGPSHLELLADSVPKVPALTQSFLFLKRLWNLYPNFSYIYSLSCK